MKPAHRGTPRLLLLVSSLVLAPLPAMAGLPPVRELSEEEAREYSLDRSFYAKTLRVEGILIATSARVQDTVLRESAYLFEKMMQGIAPPVAERIRRRGVLCIVIGHDELTSDLPQFRTDKKGQELDFYNWRQRGFLTHRSGRPTVVFAEEDAIGLGDVERELARHPRRTSALAAAPGAETLTDARDQAEHAAIREALERAGGNRTKAARLLGISRRTLYNKLAEMEGE